MNIPPLLLRGLLICPYVQPFFIPPSFSVPSFAGQLPHRLVNGCSWNDRRDPAIRHPGTCPLPIFLILDGCVMPLSG